MNDELLKEIKERIFEYHTKREKNKEINSSFNDTLVATSEVTGLSIEEIKPIADKVLREYEANKKKRKNFLYIGILALFIVAGLFVFFKDKPIKNVNTTIFITKYVERTPKLILGDVEKIIGINEKFHAFIRWEFESLGGRGQAYIKITDPTGRVAKTCRADIQPSSYSSVWDCSYQFKKGLDTLGEWKAEVFIDEEMGGQTFFTIEDIPSTLTLN